MANISAMVARRSARPRIWPSTVDGNRIFHAGRQVLRVNGLRYRFAQSLSPGVETADDALQFGKFLHQLGGEIGLGQQHRLLERSLVERNPLGSDRSGHQPLP